jgi:uncharacterized membrane protein YadS
MFIGFFFVAFFTLIENPSQKQEALGYKKKECFIIFQPGFMLFFFIFLIEFSLCSMPTSWIKFLVYINFCQIKQNLALR